MRELSLFTGAGGGLLGTHLLGWTPIGYVEWNDYCQRVIAQRIADGILPAAPIFGDIRAFVDQGYAAAYSGLVDCITAGFPCQPFSVAGKRAGADDERNMWPATIATIRAVRPGYCLLENVPGLLTSGYFGTILGDLAESGYDCRWRILSAAEVGAPHKRDRLWICAYSTSRRARSLPVRPGRSQQASTDADGLGANVADASGSRRGGSDTVQSGFDQQWHSAPSEQGGQSEPGELVAGGEVCDAEHQRPGWREQPTQICEGEGNIHNPFWWAVEPNLGRMADGVASRVDRLRAVGNGQVPAVVRAAWLLLTGGYE